MNPVLVIFIIISVLVVFLFTYGKRVQMDRLAILNECKEYEQFDKVSDSFLSKLVVRHYDLETAKLNSFISRGDKEKVDTQFDFLLNASQSSQKLANLEMRAFEYYAYEKNGEKAKQLLDLMKGIVPQEMYEFCQREYDIVINRSADYISDLVKEAEEYTGQRKIVTLYLLQLSYENAGNRKKSKEIESLLMHQKI